ncbi:mucin-2-like isoform X2 [Xyrichtys novacula]|uniref:Mucin-2-like isoform X2 n=1 Tax=Xyrichtys novacula TaxID=13765 RepID=A0AAV1F7H2_XYRNO|nr:mucin-2-like isoform X2 [Xyrichtys novacula]
MRLTALRVCGTLLAFFSLFWTTADSEEEDFLGDHGFGPCAATLRPEGSCRQGQDGSTCPYLFSLPPLTFHLPKELRELEKIVEDLQQLKDNVDQLRKMCTDCTVSQTERECGKQRERDHDDVNERKDQFKDERGWLNERDTERLKNDSQECGTDRVKAEKTSERDGDIDSEKREKLEEKEREKWDAERGSDKMVVKDNEKDVGEKDGKMQTEGAKEKDKLGQAPKVPTTNQNKRIVDTDRKKVVDKYNRETESDIGKEKDGKGNSKANGDGILEKDTEGTITSNKKDREKIEDRDHYVWGDETKETGKRTQPEEDRDRDEMKMSEGRNEHTNKEREREREERRKEMEKGIKVERNNEKPKQTESIERAEKERTIKEGAVEEDGETGKEIKTGGEKTVQSLQRDGDGELESSKSTEWTDFVSISPTDSIISAAPRHDSMDLNEAITITSSLPSPPLSSSTPHLIADVDQGKKITPDGLPTQSTGLRTGDISEQPSPGAEAGFRSTTTSATLGPLGGLKQRIPTTMSTATSTKTSSTTTPHQNLHTTTLPGIPDQSHWAAKRNISSNPKTGVKPSPGQAPKRGEKRKPEADQKLKNPKTGGKPDRAPLPDKSTKYDQKTLYFPTQSTGLRAGDISESPSPGAEAGFRSTTTSATLGPLGGLKQRIPTTMSTATSTKTSSTTTPHQNLHTTTLPGVLDQSRWAAKRNISSNSKTGVKPSPGQAPKRGEKPKPEADQKLKNPKTSGKPDRAPLPDKSTKYDQKKKPTHQKPTTDQKSKTSKDSVWVQGKKSDQTHSPDNLSTDQIPKLDHGYTTDGNQNPPPKPTTHPRFFLPVRRPTPNQRPKTENTTGSPKNPLTDRDHPNVEVQPDKNLLHPFLVDKPNQNQKPPKKPQNEDKPEPDQIYTPKQSFSPVQEPESEPEPEVQPDKNLLHPFLIDKPDQNQKPPKKPESEDKPEPDQRYTPKQSFSSVQEPEFEPKQGETTYHTPNPNQKPLTEERPKPGQKIPKNNLNPKPGQVSKPNQKHPKLGTGPKTKPNPRPKPDQTRTNNGPKTTQRGQIPNLDPKALPERNKTLPQRPLPRHKAPTRPIIKPGDTPAKRPKAAMQPEPNPETATDSDLPQISGTLIEGIQNSQTDLPPASDHEVSHPPGNTDIKPKNQNNMKTITIGPTTSNSLNTGPLPHFQIHPEGFTRSPNSRIMSDLRPKTTSPPLWIQMTTRPNKILRGIPPSVATTTSPRSTNPNRASKTDPSQNAHHVQETAVRPTPDPDKTMVPAPTPTVQVTSTVTPGIRSTTPTTSGLEPPAAESSTPSARELRVKINQTAFLNNSLIPADRRPKEDNSRPDRTKSKQPTLKPPAVTMVRDCSDHLLRGETKSGVYLVTPDLRSRSFRVFCDMELEGGGWTLLQLRQDGSVSFNRTWAEYRSGFGKLEGGEFWLGNNMIHLLTRDRDMMLRVELEDFDGVMEFAEYKLFRVASERLRYRLTVGGYSGTAGDALRFSKTYDHNNRAFTTPDRDHDRYPSGNCGAYYSSGWWFDACMAANLNGRYYVGKYKGVRDGIFWGTWHNISSEYYPTNDRQSFKAVRMMIRPKGFAL